MISVVSCFGLLWWHHKWSVWNFVPPKIVTSSLALVSEPSVNIQELSCVDDAINIHCLFRI